MRSIFHRSQTETPITAALLFFASLLYVATCWFAASRGLSYGAAVNAFGGGNAEFGLWRGEGWRLFVTAFHHAGFLHLACNAFALWQLGGLIEPRLGTLRYGLLVVGGILTSVICQAFWALPIGLSGLAFALFGFALVLRRREPLAALEFPDAVVNSYWIGLAICFPIAYFGIMPIGNTAHVAGLAYGALSGLFLLPRRHATLWFNVWLAGHVVLLPLGYLAMHPFWAGHYHWVQADRTDDPDQQIAHWTRAVRCDPGLAECWRNIAITRVGQHRTLEAWGVMLAGLRRNPGYTEGIEFARDLWRMLPAAERTAADQILAQIFPDDVDAWRQTLRTQAVPAGRAPAQPAEQAAADDERLATDAPPLPFDALDERRPRRGKLPAPDPDDPASARLGETL